MQLFSNYFGHEVKIQLVRETRPVRECRIKSPEDVYRLVRHELTALDREVFLVMCLNRRNKVLGINTVSVGSLDSNIINPREVFKPAILLNSATMILLHNHPSGDTEPSKEDIEITKKLAEAGKLIGIDVLDHIIIGRKFYSFLDNDLLPGR